jgi:hypothetical protein
MRITAIYDNGGRTVDRYSIVTDYRPVQEQMAANGDPRPLVDMLCVDNDGGHTYSQWGYGLEGKHLGKRIHFEDLNAETQAHIVKRLFNESEE